VVVIDKITTSMKEIFSDKKQQVSKVYFLQPNTFNLVRQGEMPKSAFQNVAEIAKVSHDKPRSEMKSFASVYNKINRQDSIGLKMFPSKI
jgi:hypothetical protein